jgi:hypothetical protein
MMQAWLTVPQLLASAYIQTHPNDYEPFLLGQTIRDYCVQVEAAQCEIDHVGVSALADCLIKPAGFALEVSYLDRSDGPEINTHRFETTEGLRTPTMRLLYRPYVASSLYSPHSMLTRLPADTTTSSTRPRTLHSLFSSPFPPSRRFMWLWPPVTPRTLCQWLRPRPCPKS